VLRRLDLRGPLGDLRTRLPRPSAGGDAPVEAVKAILADVRSRGDEAVREYTERFDGVRLDDPRVPAEQLAAALEAVPADLRAALETAHANITAYNEATQPVEMRHERDGIVVRDLLRPVDRAGLYVPGGRATYPSTVLMTAVPARVAGVPELVLCVPPDWRIGGAQAVAAMAYGTATMRPVDVIVGPGNIYVAVAKREVAGTVGIPSAFAGPSEVVVVADGSAPAEWAAVDVVVQAEHGPDGLAWLVTWDEAVADAVTEHVARIVAESPRRADIEATLGEGGYAVLVDGPEEAIAVANAIAPEHLELIVEDPDALLPLVRHAGAVFTGPYAPASVGDYLAGPSHVLPTFGSARFAGALRVEDFLKHVHVVTLDGPALAKVAPHVATLAETEGLAAHALSVRLREG
jgi:histidinol dehydrogenase